MVEDNRKSEPPRRAGLSIPGDDEPLPRRTGLDLSGIPSHQKARPEPEQISQVAAASGFTSRHGPSQAPVEDLPPPRRRPKRALPMVQFNGRVRPEVLRRIHSFCNAHRITNGEFLDMAIEALEPEDGVSR